VSLFAVFHDARRESEGTDPGHGRRGAELVRALEELLGLSEDQLARLEEACIHHTDGTTTSDATIQTCWDADRLDLWRVNIRPRAPWLGTEAAMEPRMLSWSRRRSTRNHVPKCAAAWLRLAASAR
jgi:uncharacterized protein